MIDPIDRVRDLIGVEASRQMAVLYHEMTTPPSEEWLLQEARKVVGDHMRGETWLEQQLLREALMSGTTDPIERWEEIREELAQEVAAVAGEYQFVGPACMLISLGESDATIMSLVPLPFETQYPW